MKINAISVALLDVQRDHRHFNRWYDMDHMPEHVSKADVLCGNRYVATGPTRRAAGVLADPLTGGHPPYATIYSYGGPLDFRDEAALAGWTDKDRGIVRAGRYWQPGTVGHGSAWRHVQAQARRSLHVSEDAIAYLPHRTVVFSIGRVADREKAAAWWQATQADAILDLEGVVAVRTFAPADTADADLMLHLVLSDADPVTTIGRIDDMRTAQRLTGRFPAHRGEYEQVALLPYERIVPFQYDFIDDLDLSDAG
ncbi:MAG: hypothetical protein Q7V88_19720 [Actinomycetota bacterium]|nr:hypothetical protein [Actinomycetota bacterium]